MDLHSDEDEEFEATALDFRDKFRQLNGKFQEILLQESTVSNPLRTTIQQNYNMFAIAAVASPHLGTSASAAANDRRFEGRDQ